MLPHFQRHEEDNLEAAERRVQGLMELLRQSNEMQRGMSAQIEALKTQIAELQFPKSRRPEQKGLPSPPRAVPNPTDSFLKYQETPPLEPVTQDMLNSQMHRLRTPRRVNTPSHRQSRTNERETSHQLNPEIDRNSSFQGPRPKDVRLGRWNQFNGSGRGMTVVSFLFRVDRLQELYDLSRQQVFREIHLLLAGAATKWYWQLVEDKAEDYNFDYYSLTQEMRRAFFTTGKDLMKVKELMERKQGPHETLSDYVSDMHNLHLKLKQKIAKDEFVELLRDNMNSQM